MAVEAKQLSRLPESLRLAERWVLWRLTQRDGKMAKVPFIPAAPLRMASSTDPATWGGFAQAVEAAPAADGVGFVFDGSDRVIGIDLDKCIDDDGVIEPWAGEIVRRMGSYAETSPSGHGVHIFIRGEIPGPRRRRGRVECYATERYFTVTGLAIAGRTVAEPDAETMRWFYETHLAGPEKPARAPRIAPAVQEGDGARREAAMRRGRHAAEIAAYERGEQGRHTSGSEADLAYANLLRFYLADAQEVAERLRERVAIRDPRKAAREDYIAATVAQAFDGGDHYELRDSPATNGTAKRRSKAGEDKPASGGDGTTDSGAPMAVVSPAPAATDPGAFVPTFVDWPSTPETMPEWMMNDFLCLGEVHLLIGQRGCGKTTLLAWLTGRTTTGSDLEGEPWPWGAVLFLSTEDDPRYKLRPLFRLHGADLPKVFVVDDQTTVTINEQKDTWVRFIADHGVKLVVLDTLLDCSGDFDLNKANEAALVMRTLNEIARATGAAVVAVVHERKNTEGNQTTRHAGSHVLQSKPRIVLEMITDERRKDGTGTAALWITKNNVGGACDHGRYLEFAPALGDDIAHRVVTLGESIPYRSVDEHRRVLAIRAEAEARRQSGAEQEKNAALREIVGEGIWRKHAIVALEERFGITVRSAHARIATAIDRGVLICERREHLKTYDGEQRKAMEHWLQMGADDDQQ